MESKEKTIEKKIKISIPEELAPLVEISRGKICVVAYPEKKYVPYIENVIKTIKDVLNPYNIEIKTLSSTVKPQESNLQSIFNLLKDCILGIVILDGLRPNVVWEYGVLYGLHKPIIVLKDKDAEIDIKNLDDDLNSKLEEYHISNPKLDIDKHLSNVKDLHYTPYDWRNPNELETLLEDALKRNEDKMLSEIKRPMITEDIKELKGRNLEAYNEFQEEFSKLAQYIIKFIKPNYMNINTAHNKLTTLAGKWKVELPPNYYFEVGNIYFNLSKYDEALKAYDKAIKIKPDDAKAWNNKGVTLDNLGRYDEEFKAYDKAIKINPDYADAWYNKGVTLGNLGRYDEALKAYDKAIEIKPDFAKAWYNKAWAYSLKGDKENSIKNLSRAIELDPKSKEIAKKDKDFKNFWNDEDFKKIVG